jgi:hypothetical protein
MSGSVRQPRSRTTQGSGLALRTGQARVLRPDRKGYIERMFRDLAQGRIYNLPAGEAPQAHLFLVMLSAADEYNLRRALPSERMLDRFATPLRRTVLLSNPFALPIPGVDRPWYRRRLPTWRFPDGSWLVRLTRAGRFEPFEPHGLGRSSMLDRVGALRAAVETGRHDLVLLYVQVHERLPRLRRELLVRALESPEEEVRLAAMWSLRPSIHRTGSASTPKIGGAA